MFVFARVEVPKDSDASGRTVSGKEREFRPAVLFRRLRGYNCGVKVPTAAELSELSTEQQLDLLEAVWDTLAANQESLPLSREHRRELDRRLEALERSPEAGVGWSDLRRDLEVAPEA